MGSPCRHRGNQREVPDGRHPADRWRGLAPGGRPARECGEPGLSGPRERCGHPPVGEPGRSRGRRLGASTEYLLAEETRGAVFVRSFARLGYRGNYHSWKARGGAYEYPDRRGTFDDEELIRYLTIHQVFDLGVFVELGQAREGVYGRLGGAVALLALANDRDTHVLTDTDYYNTYRRGWYVRPEIAVGAGLGHGVAVEVVFEPSLQFGFGETGTKIRTTRGVYVPEEKPNYRMALHRVGIRLVLPASLPQPRAAASPVKTLLAPRF